MVGGQTKILWISVIAQKVHVSKECMRQNNVGTVFMIFESSLGIATQS